MKVVAIVQARMGSSRLPGKVLKKLVGKSVIEILLMRLSQAKLVDEVLVAIPNTDENNGLSEHLEGLNYTVVRGSEFDVIERYYRAAELAQADVIVRITGDCPLVEASIVDTAIKTIKAQDLDYVSNTNPPSFPDGLDVEVFTSRALVNAYNNATSSFDREHVTPYIVANASKKVNLLSSEDLASVRLTLDEREDLDLLTEIFEYFSSNIYVSLDEVIKYLNLGLSTHKLTLKQTRNAGAELSSGQKIWKRAKQVIPGGNMLLSKRPEMHLPEFWPNYYSKASGCSIWDMDGKHYYDYHLMGVGTNLLGYSHPDVDAAVIGAVKQGNMSTLNAPEEVLLAEKLVELDPWAQMVRFARSGGEANAIAIRIARAASGRDNVAVCGYHGWHDWYLSANLGENDQLAEHLLPGLSTEGVPKSLKGNVHPFNYNDFDHISDIVSNHNIGAIKMEVYRNIEPADDFLSKVRKLASDNGVVLIFDECTSGFRECIGGLHKKYSVAPDIAIYGKTLGNGYAISAVVGRADVMEAAQSTFISSTFWTERIGSVAALKTLEVMAETKPWETARSVGCKFRDIWKEAANNHGLKIKISGLPALSTYSINGNNALAYKTLITQEFLKRGYLASNLIYTSLAHESANFDEYADILNKVYQTIVDCENGRDIYSVLDGPVCHNGFKRLN